VCVYGETNQHRSCSIPCDAMGCVKSLGCVYLHNTEMLLPERLDGCCQRANDMAPEQSMVNCATLHL
jgi:hypothetical protein